MRPSMIAIGLLLYGLSLIMPGEQWYLALAGGVLASLGIIIAARSSKKRGGVLEGQHPSSDAEIEAATMRVLKASRAQVHWTVVRPSG